MQIKSWPFPVFSLLLLLFTVANEGVLSTETLTIHEPNSRQNDYFLAASVTKKDLHEVAISVLMAEKWLKTHVLAIHPGSKISFIVVGHNVLCFSQKTHLFDLILPALKNLHHSLTRWGLEREIMVSPSFSSECLTPNFSPSLIQPLLDFIEATNSTYLSNPVELEPIYDQKTEALLTPQYEHLKKIEPLLPENINLMMENLRERKPTMRKLSFVIPPLPTPAPEISPAQDNPIAEGPLPPLVGPISFPPTQPSSPPSHLGMAPSSNPTPPPPPPPPHHHLPPCNPWAQPPHNPWGAPPPMAAEPGPGAGEKLWCVAKPSVPSETLQDAIDYACGEGGAECDEIQPNGNCYYPDSLVAHASYAFNSYWQKTKKNGGTCSFGGTGMLINSDPSFLQCKFIVS